MTKEKLKIKSGISLKTSFTQIKFLKLETSKNTQMSHKRNQEIFIADVALKTFKTESSNYRTILKLF